MGVELNIEDAETVRLAEQLAEATHQPVAEAIKQALEHELRRREEEIQATIARVREISADFLANVPEEWRNKTSKEWMDDIYDEDGLPR